MRIGKMKILIIGGVGYIGSHVVKLLLENTDNEVVVLDSLETICKIAYEWERKI